MGELADRVETAVAELANNALEHGQGPIQVRVTRRTRAVCVAVVDQSVDSVHCAEAGPDDESGRGLFLVAAVSNCWGVTMHESEQWKRVWCLFWTDPASTGAGVEPADPGWD
ncbi:ATP-binding protein [Streptomyces sp. CBMA152]|uniref:ATP-binding protein n=1 Tax=Streptomyces sp. CBMA152 TaxID=1896312 RepID=UPI0016605D10|nr:ATP-binding protein [Streptomyces sp. CBMA152]MBD0742967.1 hypothetical protein [Streptomyces sp. CBMA152]